MAVMHFFSNKKKHSKNKSEGKRLAPTVTTSSSSSFCILWPQVVNALRQGFCLPTSENTSTDGEVLQTTERIFCSAIKIKQLSTFLYAKKEDF